MQVKVHYFSVIREITRRREETIDAKQGSTVKDLLGLLIKKYGEDFQRLVLSGRDYRGLKLLFFLNGQNIETLEGFKTTLQNGSTLALLPPVAGGSVSQPSCPGLE
jgi:MoaD family protein